MLKEFMSHIRGQVSSNIEKYIGDSNFIEGAMKYSALAESKMFRAALVFASGDLNNNISNKALYREPLVASLDGNTVELSVEQMEFAENTMRYQTTLNFLNGKITKLISAIRGE